MAFSDNFAQRVRNALWAKNIEFVEQKMMGGLCFMVNDKMCVGVDKDKATGKDRLMVRTDPALSQNLAAKPEAAIMDFTGKSMRGFFFIDGEELTEEKLGFWLNKALLFNPKAKSSKRKADR